MYDHLLKSVPDTIPLEDLSHLLASLQLVKIIYQIYDLPKSKGHLSDTSKPHEKLSHRHGDSTGDSQQPDGCSQAVSEAIKWLVSTTFYGHLSGLANVSSLLKSPPPEDIELRILFSVLHQ